MALKYSDPPVGYHYYIGENWADGSGDPVVMRVPIFKIDDTMATVRPASCFGDQKRVAVARLDRTHAAAWRRFIKQQDELRAGLLRNAAYAEDALNKAKAALEREEKEEVSK